MVLTNVGKRTMDAIRAVVARMEAREERLLASQTAVADRAYDTARFTSLTVGGVGLVVVAALFLLTRRVGAERRRTEHERLHLIAEISKRRCARATISCRLPRTNYVTR